ncbi:ankyrin repeat [Fusarium pseudocircinatum]|uniref:Ankyrin repeat n=1 Tax=Fusarium pseudocircinatum TaxID=56676 RepID=A0A8H5PWL5_9HYPO|nr:ankyrin repeat [Fusarium pseudocircinatum]
MSRPSNAHPHDSLWATQKHRRGVHILVYPPIDGGRIGHLLAGWFARAFREAALTSDEPCVVRRSAPRPRTVATTVLLGDIMGWLESEKRFQEDWRQFSNVSAPDLLGATMVMKVCARKKPVFAANILYILDMDRVQGAIHHYDNNGMTAVHYAAAVGDVEALKVLLFPGNLLKRAVNIWRLQDELYRSRRLPSRPKGFKGEYLVSDCVPDSHGPPQPWLDIFEELPEETKDRIELPNITFSEWELTESESCLMPEKLKSAEKSRTPLHEAALHGRLAAVKFLLGYSGIDAKVRDVHGKTAADIALEGDYYDIHNLIVAH